MSGELSPDLARRARARHCVWHVGAIPCTEAGRLARGGVDGTLARRFGKLPTVGKAVRAKTGTINGVKCLSGILRSKSGRTRLFCILMNRRKGTSTKGASALQERMVQAIHQTR